LGIDRDESSIYVFFSRKNNGPEEEEDPPYKEVVLPMLRK